MDGAAVSGQAIEAQVTHFSFYGVGEGSPLLPSPACITPPDPKDGSHVCTQGFFSDLQEATSIGPAIGRLCAQDGNATAGACPSNANPGCCRQTKDGRSQLHCVYACMVEACGTLAEVCAATGGVWSGTP